MIARPPMAYTYGRASHRDQIEKDESVPAQIKRGETYFKTKLEPIGVHWGGVEHDSKHVSAYSKPFFKRKAGLRLLEKLRKGDYLIVDKVDRMCRRVMDFGEVNKVLQNVGVTLCFVDFFGCSIQQGTPMGDFVLHIAVSMAQFESAMTSHRIRLSREMRRDDNLWDYSKPVIGTKVYGVGKNRSLVWDHDMRAIMRDIVHMVRDHKLKYEDVGVILETQRLKKLNKPIPDNLASAFCPKFWTRDRVRSAYNRELLYQKMPHLKPAEIQRRRRGKHSHAKWNEDDFRRTGAFDTPEIDSSTPGASAQPAG